ncbi:TPA: hypothetical protein ACGUU3_004223 [Vibrio vulnificus]
MKTLTLALLLSSSQFLSKVELTWYGVVPAVVNKDNITALNLVSEVHPKYQVNIYTLDI